MATQQHKIPTVKLISLVFGLFLAASSSLSYGIEKPEYKVLLTTENIEYRQYKSYLVAVTTVADGSTYGKAATKGFMRLFRYISGDNLSGTDIAMTAPVQQKSSQKISMTSPVQQTETDQGWSVAFMLPSRFTFEDAPRPTDPQIRLEKVPARLMAVIRYSGRWTEKNFNKYESALLSEISASGITVLSEAESAVYNPPFMPPFMRHNEVMLEVSDVPSN